MTYAGLLGKLDSERRYIAEILYSKNGSNADALISSLNALDLIRARSVAKQHESWREEDNQVLLSRHVYLYAENVKQCGQNVALERENYQLKNYIVLVQQRIRNFSRIHGIGFTSKDLTDYVTDLLAAFRKLLMTERAGASLSYHEEKVKESVVYRKEYEDTELAKLKSEFYRHKIAADENMHALQNTKIELKDASSYLRNFRAENYTLSACVLRYKQIIAQLQNCQAYDYRRTEQEQFEHEGARRELGHGVQVAFYVCYKGGYAVFPEADSFEFEGRSHQAYVRQLETELEKWRNEAHSAYKSRTELQKQLNASHGTNEACKHQIYYQKQELERLKYQLASATKELYSAQSHILDLQQQVQSLRAEDLTVCAKNDLSDYVVYLYAKIATDEYPDANYEVYFNTCVAYIYYLQNCVKELKYKQNEERHQLEHYRSIVEVPKSNVESQCERNNYETANFDVFTSNVQSHLNRIYNYLVWPYNVIMLQLKRKLSDVVADDAYYARMQRSFCQVTVIALKRIQGQTRVLRNCIAKIRRSVYSTILADLLRYPEDHMLNIAFSKVNASTQTVPTRELSHHVVLYYLDDHETAEEMRDHIDQIFEVLCFRQSLAMPTKQVVSTILDTTARYALLFGEMSAHVYSLQAENDNLQIDRQLFYRASQITDATKRLLNCSYDQIVSELSRTVYETVECKENASIFQIQAEYRLKQIYEIAFYCIKGFSEIANQISAFRDEVFSSTGAKLFEQLASVFERYRSSNHVLVADLMEQITEKQTVADRWFASAAEEKANYNAAIAKWMKALQRKLLFTIPQTPDQLYELTVRFVNERRDHLIHEMVARPSLESGVLAETQTDECTMVDKAIQLAESQEVHAFLARQQEIALRYQQLATALSEHGSLLGGVQARVSDISAYLQEAYEQVSRRFQTRLEYENLQFRQLEVLVASLNNATPSEKSQERLSWYKICDLIAGKISSLQGDNARIAALNMAYASRIYSLSEQIQELTESKNQNDTLTRQLNDAFETIDGLQEELYTRYSEQTNAVLLSSVREHFYNDEFEAFSLDIKHRLVYIACLSDAMEQTLRRDLLDGAVRKVYIQLSELHSSDYSLFSWVSRVILQAGELARDEGLEQQLREIQLSMRHKDGAIAQYATIVAYTGKVLAEIVASNRQDVYQSVLMLNRDYQRISLTIAHMLE